MKILVTGGSGFIGTRLVGELLRAGHQVTIFDKAMSSKYPEYTVIGDVRDKNVLIKATASHDIIYQLAAEHADDVRPISLYHDVNVGGAKNLIAAANNAGVNNIIFTSSNAVYPLNIIMPDEESEVAPFNKYGQSKLEAEKVFKEWALGDNDRSLIIIRPVVIFGEENRGNVYNLLLQIYTSRFVKVSPGHNKKSMGYVGNIASFLSFCLNLDKGFYIFNYADKPDITMAELVKITKTVLRKKANNRFYIPYPIALVGGYIFDLLAHISGKNFPISAIRIKKFCADTAVSANRLLETGFKPPYSVRQALERTIKTEFMRDN